MESMMNGLNPTRARLLETFGLDVELTRGDGCKLYDAAGREYLDFLSQYGALPFGHCLLYTSDAADE